MVLTRIALSLIAVSDISDSTANSVLAADTMIADEIATKAGKSVEREKENGGVNKCMDDSEEVENCIDSGVISFYNT